MSQYLNFAAFSSFFTSIRTICLFLSGSCVRIVFLTRRIISVLNSIAFSSTVLLAPLLSGPNLARDFPLLRSVIT
jgi:hypothetical protein